MAVKGGGGRDGRSSGGGEAHTSAIRDEIHSIISELHQRIGERATRKQYPAGKQQIADLKALGIHDLMPSGFGHSDAKVVLEHATTGPHWVGGSTDEGEGSSVRDSGSKLNSLLKKRK